MIYQSSHKAAFLALSLSVLGAIVALPPEAIADGDTQWAYGGAANPTHWGELDSGFTQCEVGRDQSPINIEQSDVVAANASNLRFNYQATPLDVVNNGHTIQVNYQPGSTLTINGDTYKLLQFHFHTPSEHNIAGDAAPMEMHLVHQNDAGQLAVVGVMLMADDTNNPAIADIWQQIPAEGGENKVEDQMINALNLLPAKTAYYSYSGSLTTPPCSEGVSWMVLAEPIHVSERQIETFTSLYPVNARPIQATNGRQIEFHPE